MARRRGPPDWDDTPTKDEIRQMNGVWAKEDTRRERAERRTQENAPPSRPADAKELEKKRRGQFEQRREKARAESEGARALAHGKAKAEKREKDSRDIKVAAGTKQPSTNLELRPGAKLGSKT